MQTSVTISTAEFYIIATTQVDSSNIPLKVQDSAYSLPTFGSSDDTVATVSSIGVVTPVAPGVATITVTETADGNPTITGTLVVTVVSPVASSLELTGTVSAAQ